MSFSPNPLVASSASVSPKYEPTIQQRQGYRVHGWMGQAGARSFSSAASRSHDLCRPGPLPPVGTVSLSGIQGETQHVPHEVSP